MSRSFGKTEANEVGIAEVYHHETFDIKGSYVCSDFVGRSRGKCGNTHRGNRAGAAENTQKFTSIHWVHVELLL